MLTSLNYRFNEGPGKGSGTVQYPGLDYSLRNIQHQLRQGCSDEQKPSTRRLQGFCC